MWSLILLGVFGFIKGVPLEPFDTRIIGGVDAPQHSAPHMVALVHQSLYTMQVCGGSIISKWLVLTAAHCITPFVQDEELIPTFHGRVGSNTWFSGGTVVTFKSHHIHPLWDVKNIKNDVGLLVMKDEITFSKRVGLIELEMGWVGGDEWCYVTGWGRTGPRFEEDSVNLAPTPDNLQHLNVSTLTTEQCVQSLSDPQWSIAPPIDGDLEICTFHSVGHGMCNGDSGSALVSHSTGRQIGLVSWGFACARGAPDVFARLSGMQVQAFVMGKLNEYRD